jgi:ArsR family transcriptional regulator
VSSENPKEVLFTQLANIAKAVAHPHRLALLEQLAQGERSVDGLAGKLGLSVANASQHLQQLRRVGLLVGRRAGKHVLYRMVDDGTLELLAALRAVAERNVAEVGRVLRDYFTNRDSLEPVAREDLLTRLADGLVTVLDVRPPDEFVLGHVPGARNVPLAELEQALPSLAPATLIIAYCRGPYCLLSYEAVALLRAQGFIARRLEDGLPEWRAAGLPVAVGA